MSFIAAALLSACGGGSSDPATAPPTPPTPPAPPAPVAVATVTVTPDSADVAFGGTRQLSAATLDAGGAALTGRTVTWQSSNAAIASVSSAGLVTGIVPGVVTVTASSEGKQAAVRLRVVPASLTAVVDSIRQAFNLPALGAAIVTRAGGVVAIGVAGNRRWGSTTPVTLDDKWHLGSNTKTMTSVLAALAVKEGRIAWTDLMTARYPQLAPVARPAFAATTVRDLATMQSGIIGNPTFAPTGSPAQQRAQIDTWAVQQPPAGAAGTYYYSNIAYGILGEIVGRAWGIGWEQAMRDRLWTPLGVTSGGFGPTTGVGGTDQPVGHFPGPGGWTVCEACDNYWNSGADRAHMTLSDWARIVRELMRADAGESSLLTQAEARALTTGVTTIAPSQAYGYGWLVVASPAQRLVAHDGSNVRNRSRAHVYLETGVAYLLTTNAGDPAANGGAPNQAFNALVPRLERFFQAGR